jgi:hypothetical protein
MPDQSAHLYGRLPAIAVVVEFMVRPERDEVATGRTVPVVVFTGPGGCGKTALLSGLESRMERHVPFAKIDCGSLEASAPSWDVLSFLVFELNRRAGSYHKVRFPRFVTGRLVIAENLDLTDIETAQDQVKQAIMRYRRVDRLRGLLIGIAERAVDAIPSIRELPGAADTARGLAGLVVKGLISWRPGQRVALGEGLRWYGKDIDGINKLIHLNRLTQSTNDDDKREATELLWAAFLADLRAAFGTGRGKRAWSLNCAVLLDNIDSKPGVILLKELTRARQQHAVDQPGDPDPLTVVATSMGAFTREHTTLDAEIPTAEEAGYRHYQGRAGIDSEWYYPVGLRDLTFGEVVAMVSAIGGAWAGNTWTGNTWTGNKRQVAASVYRFTHGHPATTAILIKAITRSRSTGGPVLLKELLQVKWSEPTGDEPARSAEERMLLALGCDPADPEFSTLTMCSAARGLDQIEHLLRGHLILPVRGDADAVVARELRATDARSGRATMLPVLRHLLLRRLAYEPENWSQAHQLLRDNGSESERLYHAMAARDIAFVTGWLVDRLRNASTNIDDWLAALDTITSAPNDLDCDDTDPDEILKKAGWTEPQDGTVAAAARLVAALVIARDPLSSADRRKLFKTVDEELRALRQVARVGRARLLDVAERFATMAADPDQADAVLGDWPVTATGHTLPVKNPTPPNNAPPTFQPPVYAAEGRYRRWRRRALAAGAVVVIVAAVVVAVTLTDRPPCGVGLAKAGEECVGVTDGSYVFDERLAVVEKKIRDENARVNSQDHVTLALLTPMIPAANGSSTWGRIRAQLEGAHVAQLRANEGDKWPKVKLVLAHPGSNQQEWRRVVGQLVSMTDLVGVVGLVPSSRITQDVMHELAAHDLPMVGSLVTATDINKEVDPSGKPTYVEGVQQSSLDNSRPGDRLIRLPG